MHAFKQSFAIVLHTIITQLFFNFVQVWSSDHPDSHSLSEFIQELMHVRSSFLTTETYTGVTTLLQTQNNTMPVLLYICNMHIYWFDFFLFFLTFSIMWGFMNHYVLHNYFICYILCYDIPICQVCVSFPPLIYWPIKNCSVVMI